MGRRVGWCGRGVVAAIAVLLVWGGGSAQAAPITAVFSTKIPCSPQGDGVRLCSSSAGNSAPSGPSPPLDNRVPSFDGTPIDLNVTLPPAPAAGQPDGPYPLGIIGHGWGGPKVGLSPSGPLG